MRPIVSVLILNFRNANATVRCVTALQEQTIADRMEILVIDNHSSNDSIGILRTQLAQFSNVRLIETADNKGFGSGYNTGAHYARGEYLFCNNPDKLPEPSTIQILVERMQEDESIGIGAPKILHSDGTQRLSIRRFPHIRDIISRRSIFGMLFPTSLDHYLMKDVDLNATQEVDWVIGGCVAIRTDLFRTLCGFDEQFFLFFEDTDLCRRCHVLGKKVVYIPKARVFDKKNRLSGEHFYDLFLKKTGRIHVFSAVKYFWKWKSHSV